MPDEFSSSGGRLLADVRCLHVPPLALAQDGPTNTEITQTQVIGTISIDASQTRAQKVTILGSNDENKIVDSSCDFRDSLDTQQLLDAEPDTVIIPDPVKVVSSSSLPREKSQVAGGKSQDSQPLFRNFKLPDSDSPWMSHVKDPFQDTPMNNKINLLGETPVTTRVRHPFAETPDTVMRKHPLRASLDTPSGHAAHRIFNKLREDQADQSELQVDTQPVPSLAFDTQIGQTPTQYHTGASDIVVAKEVLDDKSMLSTNENDGDDTVADATNHNDQDFDISLGNVQNSQDISSQAALQIPGTAPEEDDQHDTDTSILKGVSFNDEASSPVVSEDEGDHDHSTANDTNNNTNTDSLEGSKGFEFNAEDSIQITRNRDVSDKQGLSSPNDSSNSRFLKSVPLNFDSPLANTYRVEANTLKIGPDTYPRETKSQLLVEETPSRPMHTRSDIFPKRSTKRITSSPTPILSNYTNHDGSTADYNDSKQESSEHQQAVTASQASSSCEPHTSETTVPTVADVHTDGDGQGDADAEVSVGYKEASVPTTQDSTKVKDAQADKTGSQFDLAGNVTQELSDIDDESKIDATMDEENATRIFVHEEEEGSRIFRPRRLRKRAILAVSSPEITMKRQRSSPLKVTQPDTNIPSGVVKRNNSTLASTGKDTANDADSDHDIEMKDVIHEAASNSDPSSSLSSLSSLEPTRPSLPKERLLEDKLLLSQEDVISKNSAWYLYETYFYPGMVIGVRDDIPVVKFSDRTQGATGLFPLDIRVGDTVTRDDSEYKVVGLECVNNEEFGEVIRCMRGYDTVICRKLKKTSRKKDKNSNVDIRFALADIKMAEKCWLLADRVGSEQELLRGRASDKPLITFEDSLIQRFSCVPARDPNKIFSGCLFTLTGLNDKSKNTLEDLIKSNGGVIADNGFESYVDITTDKKSLRQKDHSLKQFHFAALITGKPCRFPKYFEALALGWPVLSFEFIHHCEKEGVLLKNLLTYLLPSGASKTLHGTMKSADIGLFMSNWQRDFDLSLQLSNNRIMTRNCVLIVDADPPIAPFLFHALGSQAIHIKLTNNSKLISDCVSAMKGSVGPVYIYGRRMKALQKTLKGLESGNSKKGSILKKTIDNDRAKDIRLEIIDWDWLAECIISGYPWKSSDVMQIKP